MKYDGTYDFTGHNVKLVNKVDEYGNEYQEVEFDTDDFGTFFDVSIETIDTQEVIVASCEIWKRLTNAREIIVRRIKDGTLHTSWEIAIEKSHQGIVDGLMTKIIDVGRFIGHCLLGKQVSPAYDSSGLLEIASTNYDVEFAEALSRDIISQGLDIKNKEKEDDTLETNKDIEKSNEEIEASVEDTETSNETDISNDITEDTSTKTDESSKDIDDDKETDDDDKIEDEEDGECKKKKASASTETSALTSSDLHRKLSEECRKKLGDWCWVAYLFPEEKEVWCEYDGNSELDYLKFTYSVQNDEVTVSEPEKVTLTISVKDINTTISEYEKTISEKDDLIVKASAEITSLKSENAELSQYKQKFTEMEQAKMDAELAQKKEELISSVIKSGQITREEIDASEELQNYVNELDKKSLMAIVGERLSASVSNETNSDVETSTVKDAHVSTNLNNEDTDAVSIMRRLLNK